MKSSETPFNLLKNLVTYVGQHSEFYRTRFAAISFKAENFRSINDLQRIPFTSKEDLQQFNSEFLCIPKNKICDLVATSGTSGKAVSIALSDNDLERLAHNECTSFQTAGISSHDLIQLMTTIDKRFMAGIAYFLGARKLGAGIIRVGNGLPELQWDTIIELQPSVIICVPSFIIQLIDYAEKKGIDYKNCSVKKAICIGESIRNSDFTLNTLGNKIHQKWNIDLFSTYASSEMASAFTECEFKNGGHLQEDLLYIEIVDEKGLPVKEGEAGELVISTLGVEAMPLLRFKTGDICIAHHKPCACGRTSVRLSPVLGRKNQMIKFKGTTVYPSSIYETLENAAQVDLYQVEVCSSELQTDELIIYVSMTDTSDAQTTGQELIHSFRSSLRVVPKIVVLDHEQLKQRIYPENSRKPIKFVDKRNHSHK